MSMNKGRTVRDRTLASGNRKIYVSYQLTTLFGYVAVFDPFDDTLTDNIAVGIEPGAMCMDPAEKKLYVANKGSGTVTIIDTNNFNQRTNVRVGNINSTATKPVAVLAAPHGDKVYVANNGDQNVTIIDGLTNKVVKNVDVGPGEPFAFASNENNAYMFVACKLADKKDYVVALSIKDDSVHRIGSNFELTFDETHNPLTLHPDGHTLVTLGATNMLCFFDGQTIGKPATFSYLDNTVSGVYLDNKMLYCTSASDKSTLKRVNDLTVDVNGEVNFIAVTDIPSRKGQDTIVVSDPQTYIGITIQPTASPEGALQIYNTTNNQSSFVPLLYLKDLAFYSDVKAYVGEVNSIRPIDLGAAQALPSLFFGPGNDRNIVKNMISGYRNQS